MSEPKPSKLNPSKLLPNSQTGNTFSSFFPYLFNWIKTERHKREWKTETKYPLNPRILWEKHQDTRQIIGVRFGEQTEYCMIDVDRKSPNHPLNSTKNFDSILKALSSIGLMQPILIRSSASDGLHLYYPIEHQVNTFSLACALRYALESHRLEIGSGILETFPNTKTYNSEYMAHRLPLQDGSYIVRDDLYPVSNSIDNFCERWLDAEECQDLEKLIEQMAIARSLYKTKFNQNGKINEWKKELETTLADGWTGKGQTNDLLHKIAQYGRVFMGIVNLETLINWVTDKATQSNGFTQFCGHKSDLLKRVKEWAKWVHNHNFPMGNNEEKKEMAGLFRQKQQEAYRERIKEAAKPFSDRNNAIIPIRQMAKAIAKNAGCSQSTLYKNLSLWHPEHLPSVTPDISTSKEVFTDVDASSETSTNHIQPSVTEKPYEALGDASNPTKSSNFAQPRFQPLESIAKVVHTTKIKLIESQIQSRENGRLDRKVLEEIESLRRKLAELKR